MPNTQTKAIAVHSFQQKIFWALVACISVVTLFYFYMVGQTIRGIVDRRTAESRITDLNSAISELESQYISLGQNISLAEAENSGFREISKIEYVSRSSVLTMRDDHVQ